MMVKAKFLMFIVNLRNNRLGWLHKFWALQTSKSGGLPQQWGQLCKWQYSMMKTAPWSPEKLVERPKKAAKFLLSSIEHASCIALAVGLK